MDTATLNRILDRLPAQRVGVVGDFCLDVYWQLDPSRSEISVETGLATRAVRGQRCSLGGAGNVVNNLAALGVGGLKTFGVTGPDPFGNEMRRLLGALGVDLAGLRTQAGDWITPTYVKPLLDSREQNRIDFGNFNRLGRDTATAVLADLDAALPALDALIVNQQIAHGLHTPFFRQALNRLLRRHPRAVCIVDSRDFPDAFPGCLHKLNDVEAVRLCGADRKPGEAVSQAEAWDAAVRLFRRWRRPVFVSRSARGVLVSDRGGVQSVPGLHIIRSTDPVGAGDSMVAGIAAALAAGGDPADAAAFGNFVAGVTVQKLFQTGAATPAEVRAIGQDPDYVYRPELADDPRRARRARGSELEIVEPPPPNLRITHAIFDHDGTISSLRQGWEQVMEPVMVCAILGAGFRTADEALFARVTTRVREFIDKTTGVQTIVQMKHLVDLVREFAQVPEREILDAAGYKRTYNAALMQLVRGRVRKLRRGEMDVSDFTIKGAVEFLRRLHAAGVRLYLASGTDERDVRAEAAALGYAGLFEDRIYGAVGNIDKDAKRIVLDRILNEVGPGNAHRLVTFGDGPVEIRETRKHGGIAVGVASDELRRFGLNPAKRNRLIRAGAHLVVPDFTQPDILLGRLRLNRKTKRKS